MNEDPPLLRVVRGEPTPDELAALTVVVASLGGVGTEAVSRAGWGDPTAALRAPLRVGAGAWVASGRTPGARTRANW